MEIFSRFAMEVQRKRALVHILEHISTKKASNLPENDDPKSTSFMMKSIFCAYTTRLRLVDCANIFQIRQKSYKERQRCFVQLSLLLSFIVTFLVNREKLCSNSPISFE